MFDTAANNIAFSLKVKLVRKDIESNSFVNIKYIDPNPASLYAQYSACKRVYITRLLNKSKL